MIRQRKENHWNKRIAFCLLLAYNWSKLQLTFIQATLKWSPYMHAVSTLYIQIVFQTWFNLTFNECLRNGMIECMFHRDGNYLRELQLTYFCGSALECSQIGNFRALQQAKFNLERYYSVVGVMSDLQTTLRVMEAYLPAFFAGAEQLFQRMMSPNGEEYTANQGMKRNTTLDRRLYESLKSNLSTEYQFYEFALKRLIDQDRHVRTLKWITGESVVQKICLFLTHNRIEGTLHVIINFVETPFGITCNQIDQLWGENEASSTIFNSSGDCTRNIQTREPHFDTTLEKRKHSIGMTFTWKSMVIVESSQGQGRPGNWLFPSLLFTKLNSLENGLSSTMQSQPMVSFFPAQTIRRTCSCSK